eukprot:CAMPEP_0170404552 /NCGR_PEP_ID=MMETSP0117_2-20130122/26695_1 /TAXON_ID=400756 /ORGANISM="Durinskia baltica, Strain CSIRO CS-38" /LENGTH=162 /DNA_ID=CAMNT_0010661581 /DNA_START=70 /DNA_END=556 /DNA_ORIENTATION=-
MPGKRVAVAMVLALATSGLAAEVPASSSASLRPRRAAADFEGNATDDNATDGSDLNGPTTATTAGSTTAKTDALFDGASSRQTVTTWAMALFVAFLRRGAPEQLAAWAAHAMHARALFGVCPQALDMQRRVDCNGSATPVANAAGFSGGIISTGLWDPSAQR